VGIDRELVENLRRALRERVEGHAPSEASWEQVRRRTVDRPVRPWTTRVVQWGGMLSAAAAAGIMLFTVATAPESRLGQGTQSLFVASVPRRAVPPIDEGAGWASAQLSRDAAPQADAPLPGWPMQTQMSDAAARPESEPPIIKRMR
jgi:hypothetical protein